MCGRYNLITDAAALIDFFELSEASPCEPRYNIAPSQQVPAVREEGGKRRLVQLRWGLIPSWSTSEKTGYSLINARAETLAQKPAFRSAFRRRRCLIPATGFYEWQARDGGKQPFHIRIGEGRLFAFAGLWERWQINEQAAIESCSIVVTDANRKLAPVHDRMPVILDPADYPAWLDTAISDPAALQHLLRPCPEHWLFLYPISSKVNKPGNDDPDCIAPIAV